MLVFDFSASRSKLMMNIMETAVGQPVVSTVKCKNDYVCTCDCECIPMCVYVKALYVHPPSSRWVWWTQSPGPSTRSKHYFSITTQQQQHSLEDRKFLDPLILLHTLHTYNNHANIIGNSSTQPIINNFDNVITIFFYIWSPFDRWQSWTGGARCEKREKKKSSGREIKLRQLFRLSRSAKGVSWGLNLCNLWLLPLETNVEKGGDDTLIKETKNLPLIHDIVWWLITTGKL